MTVVPLFRDTNVAAKHSIKMVYTRRQSIHVGAQNNRERLTIMMQNMMHLHGRLITLLQTIHRPIRLTQCCTQFKSLGIKVLCVLQLHDNVAIRD